MSACVDSRGVRRGRCINSGCCCTEYVGGSTGLKCIRCTHPPGKHEKISRASASASSSDRHHPNPQPATTPSYAGVTSMGPRQTRSTSHYVHHSGYGYQQPIMITNLPCKASGCDNPRHVDSRVGVFDYCSPECRDWYLLPMERQNLDDYLKRFDEQVLASATNGRHAHSSSQESTQSSPLPAVQTGSRLGPLSSQSRDSPGKQVTFPVTLKKSPSKDFGLIISERKVICGSFSGLLVLGFEYNTEAQHMFESGEIYLLDVITTLNGKEASPFTFVDEMKKGTINFILNRSIALPNIKQLLNKAKYSNPSHLVAVRNPMDIHGCSTLKGFGLETSDCSNNYILSVTANTPARVSSLQFNDEIAAYALYKYMYNELEIGKGHLTNSKLEAAAADGKTLVLAIKR